MRVRFLTNGKLFVVETTQSNQIVFSHKSEKECYEWIFKSINYAQNSREKCSRNNCNSNTFTTNE